MSSLKAQPCQANLVPTSWPGTELLNRWPVIHSMKRELQRCKVRVAQESTPMPLPVSLGTVGTLIGLLVFWFAHGI